MERASTSAFSAVAGAAASDSSSENTNKRKIVVKRLENSMEN